jgi:hypothetical protein
MVSLRQSFFHGPKHVFGRLPAFHLFPLQLIHTFGDALHDLFKARITAAADSLEDLDRRGVPSVRAQSLNLFQLGLDQCLTLLESLLDVLPTLAAVDDVTRVFRPAD